MHPYSTDSSERKWVPLMLLFISIPIALVLKIFWEGLHFDGALNEIHFIIGILIDFSVIFFYEIFYHIFDKLIWRFPLAPFVKVPNLNGKWEGKLNSSFCDGESDSLTDLSATMDINQTWQEIMIKLKTEDANSKTLTASFFTKNQDSIELYYQYLCEPNINAADTMHIHKGTGMITLSADKKSFEGDYYNGRDSKNHGNFKFEKTDD